MTTFPEDAEGGGFVGRARSSAAGLQRVEEEGKGSTAVPPHPCADGTGGPLRSAAGVGYSRAQGAPSPQFFEAAGNHRVSEREGDPGSGLVLQWQPTESQGRPRGSETAEQRDPRGQQSTHWLCRKGQSGESLARLARLLALSFIGS